MQPNLRKTLRALSLELRHILEGRYDGQGDWQPGDLEPRLNELGIWREREPKQPGWDSSASTTWRPCGISCPFTSRLNCVHPLCSAHQLMGRDQLVQRGKAAPAARGMSLIH